MPTLTALFGLLRSALADRQRLLLENAAPRHQVAVLKRSVSRPRIEGQDPHQGKLWQFASARERCHSLRQAKLMVGHRTSGPPSCRLR